MKSKKSSAKKKPSSSQSIMNTVAANSESLAVRAWVEDRMIFIELTDERVIAFPASRFRRLKDAPDALLDKVRIEVNGYALRWDELDEDITVPGVVAGHFELPPSDQAG
jgi:hypothetical protein